MYFIFFGFIFCFGFIKSTDLEDFVDPSIKGVLTIHRIHKKIPLLESKGRLYVPFIIRSHFPSEFSSSQFAQNLRKYVQVLFKKHYPEHSVPYPEEYPKVNRSTHQTMGVGNTLSIYSSANLAPKTLFSSSGNLAINGKTNQTGSKMGIPIIMPPKESSANQTEMVMGIPIQFHQLQNRSVNEGISTFTVSNSAQVSSKSGNISMFGSFGYSSGKQQNKQDKEHTPTDDNRNIIWINPSRITRISKGFKSTNNLYNHTNGGFQLIGNQQEKVVERNKSPNDKNTKNMELTSLLGISTKSTGIRDQISAERTISKGKDNFLIWQVPVFEKKQTVSPGFSKGKPTEYKIINAVEENVDRKKMPTIRNHVLATDAGSNVLKDHTRYKIINAVEQKGKRFKVKAITNSMLSVGTRYSDLTMRKPKIKGKYRDKWKDLILNSQKKTDHVTQPRVNQKKRNFNKIPFHDRKMTENIRKEQNDLFLLNGKQKFVKSLSKPAIPKNSLLFKPNPIISSHNRQMITKKHNNINRVTKKREHSRRLKDMQNMVHTKNSRSTTDVSNNTTLLNILAKAKTPDQKSQNEDKLPSITVALLKQTTQSRPKKEPPYRNDQKEKEQKSTDYSRRVEIHPYMNEQKFKQLKYDGMFLHNTRKAKNKTLFAKDKANNIQHRSNEIFSKNHERKKKENKIPKSTITHERNLHFIKKKIQSNRDQIRTEQINKRKKILLNADQVRTEHLNLRKKIILNADQIHDKDVSQNKIKNVGQQKRFHSKMNAIKMPHSQTRITINKKSRNLIRNLTSLQDPNYGNKDKIQSNRDLIRTKQINRRKKLNLNANQIKEKNVSHNERKTVGQQKRLDNKINAIKIPHSQTSIKMNKTYRNAIRNRTSLQNPNDGDKNTIQFIRDQIRTKKINLRKKMLLNADQIRAEQINIRKKILLNADQIKDKDVSHNERKTVGQRKRLDSKINAIKIPHSQTSIKMNKEDRNAIRNSLQNPNDGDINKIQANRDLIRTEQIDIRNKILLNADQIKDKDLSQNERKTVRPQERINSEINAIKIPHIETSIKMNQKDRTAIRNLTFLQDPNGGDPNKIRSNRDLIRTEQINTRNKILLNTDQIRAEQIDIRNKIVFNADQIKDNDLSQNERKTVISQERINSKINAIKMPHSETSIKMNKKDRTAIRNLNSLQDPNDGHANKIQSSRDKIRTKQFNKRKKIVLNADQIKDKDVSHNERKTVGQRKSLDSKINAIKISHSQTSIKMNKKDRNAFRNLTSLHNPNDGDINKIQAKRDQIRTEQIDIRNKILLNADQIKDKDLSQKERKTVRPQEKINSKINAIKIPHSETSIKMNKKDRTAIRDLTFVQDPNGGDTNKIQLNRDLIRTEQINTRNKILLNADKIRAEQINIRKNILLNANQIRTKQFNKRKKILLNSDKIKDKDVSQNERKVVGPQKTINSKPNAIKIPYSETSITINKKDRNAIRNRTSLQNQNDGDTNTHNKFHYNDKSNDSVGSRLKPVIRSLNSFQLVDQLVHKRGQKVLKSKAESKSGSKVQSVKGYLNEYPAKANTNISNYYTKGKRQFENTSFKNQQGRKLSRDIMNLDNSINVNDQETNTNQILLNVGSHATNNDNMLKKPVEKTYANSEKNNKQLAIDYYSIDYVSRQPMKEVFTDLEYKRKHSKNNQTKQIRKVQEIVQGNNSISLTNLIKTKNGNYASKRTDISYPKPKTTSNIQTTITVTKRHPLEQLKTVIHEIKMNVDFNNNNLQSNNQISTNKDFRGINGNKTIPSDLRYHHDLVQQLPVTTRLNSSRYNTAIEIENTNDKSLINETYDRNEKSRTSIEQSGKRTFKRKSVDGINMNIRNSRKESLELSERNNLSTNKVTVPKSVSKLIDNKSIAQDFQNRLHFQQLKRDKYNVGLQPIQSNIPYRKERHPKSNTNNTERITNTKSIKLSERIHQVRTDNPPPISISQISSDKVGNQIPLQESLSTRKYNHRLELARNKPRQISVDKSNYVNNTEGSVRTKPTDLLKRRNHVIHDTLPQLITQRDSGIESVSNIENSENQQNTESDLSKHLKMNVKQSDFPQTKTKLHGHMNLYPQKLESNFISSKKMTGNVQQSTHPTLNWQNNLTKGVLTRSTNKELLKTPVKNLQTQSVEKLDEQKRIQQKTKRKTIFSLQHFGTSIKKPSEESSTQSVDTNIYDIQAESEITNPVNPNVSKTHLKKKDSSKDKLEIQAEDNNSDYYYYEDDDATTDVLVLELPAEETISENKATENNFQKSSNSNKNVEPDINENSEYYDYDSYSESFEDNGALSKTKSTVKILTESNKDQSRHTDAFHNVNPVKNLNSEQSQKNQINSHIDGEFSDYTESDDYSDSNYDDSAEVTANDKGQLNNRIVNPQSPKTIDNEGPDFYYDDSLLSEEKDNGEDYYYDSGDSDIYYDESDLSNKRQIATTSKQMIKRKTITESEVGKTMPSNLVKAYERIRKLCLCNSVNGRTTSDILMQRYA